VVGAVLDAYQRELAEHAGAGLPGTQRDRGAVRAEPETAMLAKLEHRFR
jgi:hypothetical protein